MWDSSRPGRKIAGQKVFRRYFPLFIILWILVVLYPNPLNIIVSIQRAADLGVDPGAVEVMLDDLPSDPVAVEKAVLARIPYGYDWEVYGMPWYFPTVQEVLERERGDCKARALVLASVLEARGIPYRVNMSPMHIWVEYESKAETPVENPDAMFYQRDPQTGETQFQVPRIELIEVMDAAWRGFWPVMPLDRKILLVSGLLALIAARVLLFRARKQEQAAVS